MLYNIWSVRDQGWERALVVARPEDRGRPEGDFVTWLGASDVLIDDLGDVVWTIECFMLCDSDVVQRELKKLYTDTHPLGVGTIARKVREKIWPPDLSRPEKWQYWGQRCADAVLAEMRRRGLNVRHPLNKPKFVEAMLELWRI